MGQDGCQLQPFIASHFSEVNDIFTEKFQSPNPQLAGLSIALLIDLTYYRQSCAPEMLVQWPLTQPAAFTVRVTCGYRPVCKCRFAPMYRQCARAHMCRDRCFCRVQAQAGWGVSGTSRLILPTSTSRNTHAWYRMTGLWNGTA